MKLIRVEKLRGRYRDYSIVVQCFCGREGRLIYRSYEKRFIVNHKPGACYFGWTRNDGKYEKVCEIWDEAKKIAENNGLGYYRR